MRRKLDLKTKYDLASTIHPDIQLIVAEKPGEAWLEMDGETHYNGAYFLHIAYNPGDKQDFKYAGYSIEGIIFDWPQDKKMEMARTSNSKKNILLWTTLLTIPSMENVTTIKLFDALKTLGLKISTKELRERLELYRRNQFSANKRAAKIA